MKPIIYKAQLRMFREVSRQNVIAVLFRHPEKEFSLSDLAKEAGVAKANIGVILSEFSDAGLITIEKLSKIWRIRANISNQFYRSSKIAYNLNFACNSGIVEYLADRFSNPKAIVLFGSFRKGEDISESDIDIAIESGEAKGYETISLSEISGFEKIIGRKIQIHLFTRKDVDTGVFNNIANGFVLWGFLEVKK